MKQQKKAIISCAITGSIHTPSMSAYLPVTPDQIARHAVDAAKAGASIVHLHARDPETGKPSSNPELFKLFLPTIKDQCNAVVAITTGGALGMTLDERLAAAKWASPELASMNMGSFNFAIFEAANKISEFKYAWEKPFLESTRDCVMSNTFTQIERAINELGAQGTRFEFECYDVGHLYNLAYFLDKKLVKPPLFVQAIFGILGGIGAEIDNLIYMARTADRLFGDQYHLSVLAAGRHQMPFVTIGAILGGNVRVGLEDSLYAGKGQSATSNAEQVCKIRRILQELSFDIATPAETRAMLQLKGHENVNF